MLISPLFKILGQKLSNFFVGILVQTMTPEGHFEINWPLVCFWESQPEDSSSIRIFISSGSILSFCNFHPIMSDSWGHFGPPYPQFYIQMVYKPHLGARILLFWPFGQLRAVRKKRAFLSNFWVWFFQLFVGKTIFWKYCSVLTQKLHKKS